MTRKPTCVLELMDTVDKVRATETNIEILKYGELNVTGRLVDASNATLFATLVFEGRSIPCIYKPVAGERPLWDFPDGTLAHREFAAYCVSHACGFDCVPLTILRNGPYGEGMVQEWINIDESIDLFNFFSSDNPALRSMALFDAVINNTDRKIGHLLPTAAGQLFGCDHGVTFHSQNKLRTVLWQWSGDALTALELDSLKRTRKIIENELDLTPYLTSIEISALTNRVENLISKAKMPEPDPDWPAVPWPAF